MIFRCKHCGDLSRDEYLACEQPYCDVEKIGSAPVPLSEASDPNAQERSAIKNTHELASLLPHGDAVEAAKVKLITEWESWEPEAAAEFQSDVDALIAAVRAEAQREIDQLKADREMLSKQIDGVVVIHQSPEANRKAFVAGYNAAYLDCERAEFGETGSSWWSVPGAAPAFAAYLTRQAGQREGA